MPLGLKIDFNGCISIYFIFSDCLCNMTGSQSTDCNDNGKCTCKTNLITGKKCSECIDGRINFPECSGISFLYKYASFKNYTFVF